jgi:hypothetical protein
MSVAYAVAAGVLLFFYWAYFEDFKHGRHE